MKDSLFIILALLFFGVCFSQEETVIIDFYEADPIWEYVVEDTTFVEIPGQPYWTRFSSVFPNKIIRDENDLYVLSTLKEGGSLLDNWGFILNKINISTGQEYWNHINSKYNDGIQDYYDQLKIVNDNVVLFGVKRHGLLDDKNWAFGAYNSNSIYKLIDTKTGLISKEIIGKDTLHSNVLPNAYFKQFCLSTNSDLFLTSLAIGADIGSSGNPVYNYGNTVKVSDNNLDISHSQRLLFDLEELGPFSIDQPNFTEKLNENTLISLVYKDRFESWNPETQLMWINIQNPFEIKVDKILNLTDILPGSKSSFVLHRFKTINNSIFLTHQYPNIELEKITSFILWLNKEGEIKSYVPITNNSAHMYELVDVIYAEDEFAYLYGAPSSTSRNGIDILRLDIGTDTVKYISSLTTSNNKEYFTGNFHIHSLFADGIFIIGGYTSRDGELTKKALKLYYFEAEDLNINFEPTSTTNTIKKEFDIKVFPNPTTGILNIKGLFGNISYMISTITGEVLGIGNTDEGTINLTNFSSGMYFLKLINNNQSYSIRVIKS
jgi:hypothetical protein